MIALDGRLTPENGAPVLTMLQALVTAQIRTMRGHNHPDHHGHGGQTGWAWEPTPGTAATHTDHTGDDGDAADATDDGVTAADVTVGGGAGTEDATDEDASADGANGQDAPTEDPDVSGEDEDSLPEFVEARTIPQLNAAALAAACRHMLGCDQTTHPLAATTVVVRIPLEALTTGTGIATIDGITQPIDPGTARRMAADADIIPLVLGGDSEILDLGRRKRLFTPTQRLALTERDGGCAGCGAPPDICEAHHLTWWSHGGTTDLNNGILLCTSCHHRIHADDWQIRIDGPNVWFIPPAHIDPTRTPQPGGRRKYDYNPAA